MTIHVPEVQIWLCKCVDLTFIADANETKTWFDLYLNISVKVHVHVHVCHNSQLWYFKLFKNRKYKKVFNHIKRIWLNQHIWSNIVMSQSVLADRHYININSIKSKIRKQILCYKKRWFPVQFLFKTKQIIVKRFCLTIVFLDAGLPKSG